MGKIRKQKNYLQIMVPGFLVVILTGAFLLMMPFCNTDGKWLPFVDALFSSCTSVCVTGLATVVPATQFTLAGKLVILVLVQIGGWGVIVCAMYLLMLLKRRFMLHDRLLLQEYFNADTMRGLVRMLRYVVKGSLIVEVIGSVGYFITFFPRYGLARGIWYSVFHAVSAFCNAGLDILGDSSLANYAADPWINFVTMTLIIAGGLGFVVWREISKFLMRMIKEKMTPKRSAHKMTLHSKLVLLMTAGLIISGTLFFAAVEWNNPATLGSLGTADKWLAALFQSVTTRTAGFYTISQGGLREASKFFACVLMFIGGSPVGTAGGIKTVTLAVLFLASWTIIRGYLDAECFGRTISIRIIRTSIAIFLMGLFMVISGSILISILEPGIDLMDILYEVVSATATVGLTTGITPILGTKAKYVIIFLMYVGRIGPMTLPLFVSNGVKKRKGKRTFPEEHILVG